MAEGEFRYLTPHAGEGVIHAALLPSDNLYNNQDRKLASWHTINTPATTIVLPVDSLDIAYSV